MASRRFKFRFDDAPHYPFIRVTSDRFPRFLATRLPGKGDGRFFGPFLDRTAARMLIDFLNTTFKMRTCAIEIDGGFSVPCVQFYHRRCLAPCVASLCSQSEYESMAKAAQMFLSNDREKLSDLLTEKIEQRSAELDFENAAAFRDMLARIQSFWREKKLNVWLDDAVDTIDLETHNEQTTIRLVTQRGRRFLGSRTFSWPFVDSDEPTRALSDLLLQFYKRHVPREIRISHELPDRKNIIDELSRAGGKKIKLKVVGPTARQVTTRRHLTRTRNEDSISRLAVSETPQMLTQEMASLFDLPKLPRRIAAFDSAHISGAVPTAARCVWEDGYIDPTLATFAVDENSGDIRVLADFVRNSLMADAEPFDLLLIDGGIAHLQAVKNAVSDLPTPPFIVAAAKPADNHNAISYFLTATGRRVEYANSSGAMRLLTVLRNEAHALANFVHAEYRDMAHFYELAAALPSLTESHRSLLRSKFLTLNSIARQTENNLADVIGKAAARATIKDLNRLKTRILTARPLIVPIFYIDPNGDAQDLRPIKAIV